MALKKLQIRPGVNKEVTAYSAEGGWIDADKVRFRNGFPEKIGGWRRFLEGAVLGVCRALTEWSTLGSIVLYGVGTNIKYYVIRGATAFDITPLRLTTAAGVVTFTPAAGSLDLRVNHTAHGAKEGDFVTFSGAVSLGGAVTAAVINREYEVGTVLSGNTYNVRLLAAATGSDTGTGGAAVVAAYQIPTGLPLQQATEGWGAGGWGEGTWGVGTVGSERSRDWNHANYGEDLIFGPAGGRLYYFDVSLGVSSTNRGTLVTGTQVPLFQNHLLVSDVSRFVIVFGCNELGQTFLDPMLVRWSDQENHTSWSPAITNQAGGQRLSAGSLIMAVRQGRQEILVWTDTALYSMQYQGPPFVWGFQLMGENVSIMSARAATLARNEAYWMGQDKFYRYDGRVQTLRCDLLRSVFSTLNYAQREQVFSGTNEAFNEVWWFYPTGASAVPDSYVVFNYEENTWYNGRMQRTAWLDSRLRGNPLAANGGVLVDHERGVDDGESGALQPLVAHIESAPVDIDDGDRFAFVWRILPDITFTGSSVGAPRVNLTLIPQKSSGQGRQAPASEGGVDSGAVLRATTAPVEAYTQQLNIRVRGRQLAMKVSSDALGVAWQLGSPQVDMKPDGRRG